MLYIVRAPGQRLGVRPRRGGPRMGGEETKADWASVARQLRREGKDAPRTRSWQFLGRLGASTGELGACPGRELVFLRAAIGLCTN